jgi:hypothetical protein
MELTVVFKHWKIYIKYIKPVHRKVPIVKTTDNYCSTFSNIMSVQKYVCWIVVHFEIFGWLKRHSRKHVKSSLLVLHYSMHLTIWEISRQCFHWKSYCWSQKCKQNWQIYCVKHHIRIYTSNKYSLFTFLIWKRVFVLQLFHIIWW